MGGSSEFRDPALHTLHVDRRVHLNRVHALVYACAIVALFYHRSLSLLNSPTFLSFSLFLSLLVSESVIALLWAATQAFRWRPVSRQVFPEHLDRVVDRKDYPALDVFICTADPYKEPPMGVVNTALSVMAYDYPTDKLSVYVSDDGGSQLTLFAFMEAARFARYWLPFCRQHGLDDRSPEVYFKSCEGGQSEKIKRMYERMKEKVESVVEKGSVSNNLITSDEELQVFKQWTDQFTRHEHPSVIQVLLESNKDVDITDHVMPNLVYVSREKSKTSPHHFKAGALNVLLRVSGTMTNAPVVLTLDCDMYSNDPQTPQQALCFLLDREMAPNLAFVQFPQRFEGINQNDIYASEYKRVFTILAAGMNGLRGPVYVGSGSFFARRALHGSQPPLVPSPELAVGPKNGRLVNGSIQPDDVGAYRAASCMYEDGTNWGITTGFRYGSLVEDFHTGYRLHCEGWKSVFCNPRKPAFLGDAPFTLNDSLTQCKRWCVGLLEVAFSKHCPLTFGTRKASFLMGLGYVNQAFWGTWCIPVMVYSILPQIALFHQVPLFPKVSDPWFYLYAYLFMAAYAQDLLEFVIEGGTIRKWWNDQRIWMIRGATSFLLGTVEFSLKQIGVSTSGFNVTSKLREDEQRQRYENGLMEFGMASPFFVILGTIAILNLSSFIVGLGKAFIQGSVEDMLVQLLISGFVVVNCWPIYEAMVLRKDAGRIPNKVTRNCVFLVGAVYSLAYVVF